MSDDPQYDAEQQRMHARYREVLARYLDKPFAARHTDVDLEAELTLLEEAMLAHPPMCKVETDDGRTIWVPRKKGLIGEPQLIPRGELPEPTMVSVQDAGIRVVPLAQWSDILTDRNWTPPSHYAKTFCSDQDGVGSCGAEGSAGGLMTRRIADGQQHVMLNPWFVYNTTSGGRDGGSNPLDNLSFLQKYGCASEKVWPRSKGWRTKPSDEAYQDALNYRILPDGLVRIRSWEELGSMAFWFSGGFGYSGHWIEFCEPISTSRIKYHNSWGPDFGDNGFSTLSRSSIYEQYGMWAVIAVTDRTGP